MLKRSLWLAVAIFLLLPVPAFAAKPVPSECTITPDPDGATFNVGDLQTYFVLTTGCATSEKIVRFKVVDGDIPDGMKLFTQGVS